MKKSYFLIMMLSLVFILAACGSTQKSAGDQPGTTPSPSNTNQTNSATSAPSTENTLDHIKKAGKIVIMTTGNYRPYTYMDNSKLVGYDIELGDAIAKHLGVKSEFVTAQPTGLIAGLTAGKVDILISGMNITDDRKKSVDFSTPYAHDGAVTVVKKGSDTVKGIADIKGKTVGTNAGSVWEAIVKEIGGYKELKGYPGPAESFQDLMAGRIDAVIIGQVNALDYIANSPAGKDVEMVGQPYSQRDIAVVLRQNNPDLKAEIDKVIQQMQADGTDKKLKDKYNLPQ